MFTRIRYKAEEISRRLMGQIPNSKWFSGRSERFSEISQWVDQVDEQGTVLLESGALGAIYRIDGIASETDRSMVKNIEKLVQGLDGVINDDLTTIQFQWESYRSKDINLPSFVENPKTLAQRIYSDRANFIRTRVDDSDFPLKKTEIHLTIRLDLRSELDINNAKIDSLGQDAILLYKSKEVQLKKHYEKFKRDIRILEGVVKESNLKATRLSKDSLLKHLNHCTSGPKSISSPFNPAQTLREQVSTDFVELKPDEIRIRNQTWHALSWRANARSSRIGVLAKLLQKTSDLKFVVNIRKDSTGDLGRKRAQIHDNDDYESNLAREDLDSFQEDVSKGSSVFSISCHAFVGVDEVSDGYTTSATLSQTLGIPFVYERFSGAGIWLLNLPLCYGPSADYFIDRKRRVTSRHLGIYLPIFRGWNGTNGRSGSGILMQSRAGNAVRIAAEDNDNGPHTAVLAVTGGGKSFLNAFIKTCHLAGKPDLMQFFIDQATSYEVYAYALGEDIGFQVITPPETLINPWRGEMNEHRFAFMTDMLTTAMKMISDTKIGNNEQVLLTNTIEDAYREKRNQGIKASSSSKNATMSTLRLSDVVEMLPYTAKKLNLKEHVVHIRDGLRVFCEGGLYGHIFDLEDQEPMVEPTAPGITLVDLSGLTSDKTQRTLAIMVVLGEIFRQRTRQANDGRHGSLDIEELGILAKADPRLADFITEAWKRFRKANISCTALTNEPSDYVKTEVGQTVWSQSTNKYILKVAGEEALKITEGSKAKGNEYGPLLPDRDLASIFTSLSKIDGEFADALFVSSSTKGSFRFIPDGWNYWLGASKEMDKKVFHQLAGHFKKFHHPYGRSLTYLAKHYPEGVRDSEGNRRSFTHEELDEIPTNSFLKEFET